MKRKSYVGLLALLAILASPVVLLADQQSAAAGSAESSTADKPQPPAPSSAPVIVAADSGDGLVAFTWTAVPNATAYQIFRTTTGVWDKTPFAQVTGTRYSNNELTNGATYSYRVAAVNAAGTGPYSTVVAAIPFAASALVSDTTTTDSIARETEARASENSSRPAAPANTARAAAGSEFSGIAAWTAGPQAARPTSPQAAAPVSETASMTPARSDVVAPKPQAPQQTALAMPIVQAPIETAAVATGSALPSVPSTAPVSVASVPTTPAPTGTVTAEVTTPSAPTTTVTTTAPPPAAPPITAVGPAAPTGVAATAGDASITLTWSTVVGATSYNVYRGTAPNPTVRAYTALLAPPLLDSGLINGTTYYYRVTAVNAGGESAKSSEVNNSPVAPPAPPDPATVAAFRLLRQSTWGPKPGEVDNLKNIGVDAFLTQQLSAPPSTYPDTLFTMSVEDVQERFMANALTGTDQLRQRVAWALHKIWVISANDISNASGIVTYHRLFMNGAFGNYRDLMRDVTLNPGMGRYLNMLNNKSLQVTGSLPNENYARELMQLFTIGIPKLDQNGTPAVTLLGTPLTTYTEQDVKELARIFTGWTYGDGNPATIPTSTRPENFRVPMEAVAAYHDKLSKVFLGQTFPANQTARQDLDQALDILFNDPNVGPFVASQLIKQLVTSNPSKAYVAAVAAKFNDNGSGVRGDLAAVVREVLTNAEAGVSTATSGKLSEPALYVISQLRGLNATVADHPFMANEVEQMGQKVLYPGSVFSYFSPGYKVRGTTGPGGPLTGPEFQILTSVTALERANFPAALIGGWFGTDVTIDYTPFTSRAADAVALVDYCSLLFMGGRMSPEARLEIINAVRASSATNMTERVRTALYLTLTAAQFQVDR